jgi:hypothetical protein
LHIGASGQLTDARQVIIVLMGIGRVANAHALRVRFLKIGINIAPHIKHQRLAGLL